MTAPCRSASWPKLPSTSVSDPMTRAAILCRVSTGGQADNTSIPDQRRLLTEMCEARGWPYEVFEEVHSGGDRLEDRPIFRDIMARIKSGEFSRLVVLVVDRSTRAGAGEMERIGKLLAHVGARLVTRRTEYDPREAEDQIDLESQALDARKENLRRRERTIRGRDARVKEGGFGGHPIPYGWKRIYNPDGTSRFEIVADEADRVRRIFEAYATGTIGMYLIAEEVGLSPDLIKRILPNPRYAGMEVWRRHRTATSHLLPGITVESKAFPAIVSLALFERAQGVKGRRATGGSGGKVRWPLAGIIRCWVCAGRMETETQDAGRYAYYKCVSACPGSRRLHAGDCHAAVLRALPAIKAHWEGMAYTAGQDEQPDRAGSLRAQLAALDKSEAELWRAKMAGMDEGQYARQNQRHLDERAAIDAELHAIKRRTVPSAGAADLGKDLAIIAADPGSLADLPFLRSVFVGALALAIVRPSAATTKRGTLTVPLLEVVSATDLDGHVWPGSGYGVQVTT